MEYMAAYLLPNIILFIVNVILVSVLVYYLKSLKRKGRALSHFESNASQKVEKIIEAAREKGEKILLGTDYLSQNQAKLLEDTLTKIREDNLKAVEKNIERLTALTEKTITDQEASLTKQYLSKMEENWVLLQKNLQSKTEEDTRKYKEARIAQLDKEISNQVLQISAKVLNKSIPLNQHNDQVIAALEQAKKEGLFNF